jgi:hypothetical protein
MVPGSGTAYRDGKVNVAISGGATLGAVPEQAHSFDIGRLGGPQSDCAYLLFLSGPRLPLSDTSARLAFVETGFRLFSHADMGRAILEAAMFEIKTADRLGVSQYRDPHATR